MSVSSNYAGLVNLLPVTYTFPNDWDQFLVKFQDLYRQMATAINASDYGIYELFEQGTRQQWFNDAPNAVQQSVKRATYRQVFFFPSPLVAVNTVAHNIPAATIADMSTTQFSGGISNPANAGVKFASAPQGSPNDVMVEADLTNVILTVPAAYQGAGWTALIVWEYLKN